jgi:hypothetical protein
MSLRSRTNTRIVASPYSTNSATADGHRKCTCEGNRSTASYVFTKESKMSRKVFVTIIRYKSEQKLPYNYL